MKLHTYQTRQYSPPKTPSTSFVIDNIYDQSTSWSLLPYSHSQTKKTPSHTPCASCVLIGPSSTIIPSVCETVAVVHRQSRNMSQLNDPKIECLSQYSLSDRANPKLLEKLVADRQRFAAAELDEQISHRPTEHLSISSSSFESEMKDSSLDSLSETNQSSDKSQMLTIANVTKLNAESLTLSDATDSSEDNVLHNVLADLQGIRGNVYGNLSRQTDTESIESCPREPSHVRECFHKVNTKSDKVYISNRNLIITSMEDNGLNWYNVFGKVFTESDVQYHWKIRVKQLNHSNSNIMIGILDAKRVEEFRDLNDVTIDNRQHFALHRNGYGIDSNGSLWAGGIRQGTYCGAIAENDVIDVYFDTKHNALWYGLDGNVCGSYNKVKPDILYNFGVSVFGPQACVEIMYCTAVYHDVDTDDALKHIYDSEEKEEQLQDNSEGYEERERVRNGIIELYESDTTDDENEDEEEEQTQNGSSSSDLSFGALTILSASYWGGLTNYEMEEMYAADTEDCYDFEEKYFANAWEDKEAIQRREEVIIEFESCEELDCDEYAFKELGYSD